MGCDTAGLNVHVHEFVLLFSAYVCSLELNDQPLEELEEVRQRRAVRKEGQRANSLSRVDIYYYSVNLIYSELCSLITVGCERRSSFSSGRVMVLLHAFLLKARH